MRVYRLVGKVLTPLVVTSGLGYRGFVHVPRRELIPGSVIKGALLTQLLREGLASAETVNNLALSPDFAVTPMLAADREGRILLHDLLISHALCAYSKWRLGDGGRSLGRPLMSPGLHEVINVLRRGADLKRALEEVLRRFADKLCDSGKLYLQAGEVKSAQGVPVAELSGMWWTVTVRTSSYVEVALDHARGAAAPEMLYAYEYVRPGTLYSGLVAVLESSPLLELLKRRRFTLSVGRGVSRGFGKLLIVADEVKLPELGSLRNDDYVAFVALSPIFVLSPLPTPPQRRLSLEEEWYRTFLGEGIKLKLRIIGALGSGISYSGWSLRTRKPKLTVRGLGEGGILLCKVEIGQIENAALLTVLGLDHFASAGFNQVIPLFEDPFSRWEPWK